jgi:hypothetical protein
MKLRFTNSLNRVGFYITFVLLMACVGCAGPMTPFGAISQMSGKPEVSPLAKDIGESKSETEARTQQPLQVTTKDTKFNDSGTTSDILTKTKSLLLGSGARPVILFSPDRQHLHGKSRFVITIKDGLGVPRTPDLTLLYNGYDLTTRLLAQAEMQTSEGGKTLKVIFPNLRLLADRDNKIEVVYRHSKHDNYMFARHMPPTCDIFADEPVVNLEGFKLSPHLIKTIHKLSLAENVNPSFMTGLIAQESGFNQKAVSWAKAIGLTQVTSLAEQEISKFNADWPRYGNIQDISTPIVKAMILSGKINANNEWRLDPQLSIKGGITYVKLLAAYWRRPDNWAKIVSHYRDPEQGFTEVLLASYNSGFVRVGNALEHDGPNWIRDDELREARKYVNRVMSYCYHFAKSGDEDADPT